MSLILIAMAARRCMRPTVSGRTSKRGAKAPSRMDMQRCQWIATIIVGGALSRGPALTRTVSIDKQFSGSEAGACTPGRKPGERNMAQHHAEIREHLIAVAEKDRAPLLAELDAVRSLASN